jgi:hypothetical protein
MRKRRSSAKARQAGGYEVPILVEPGGRAARARAGRDALKEYWLHGEGAAKWVDSPHPWTTLYGHLRKYLPDERAKRTAAEWFHAHFGYWPGADRNRVAHGRPPRGDKVGPG